MVHVHVKLQTRKASMLASGKTVPWRHTEEGADFTRDVSVS